MGSAPRLVLASGSPRRRQLLALLRVPFTVVVPEVDEAPLLGESPESLVRRLALAKAEAVAGEVVLAADTIVDIDGDVLGKPGDDDEARAMLTRLSGRSHWVHTGVAVRHRRGLDVEVVATEVVFAPLTRATIERYVATGEPLDKAGAYAMQGAGGAFVTAIAGSPSNVVGLPLATVAPMLAHAGLSVVGATSL